MAIPLGDNAVLNIQYFGTLAEQRIITLFQYQLIGASDHTVDYFNYFDDINTEMVTALDMDDKFLSAMPSNYTLDFRRIQQVYPARMRFKDYFSAGAGTWAQDATTPNIATSLERYGLIGGRTAIGRVQLPIPDGTFSDGIVTDFAYQGAVLAVGNQFLSGLSPTPVFAPAAVYKPVIYNPNRPNAVPRDVKGITLQTTVRTMHRRTVGLGI